MTRPYIFIEKKIDGKAFTFLTREDFSLIFPGDENFLLGSNLYRISQKARLRNEAQRDRQRGTQSLLDELSELDDDNISYSSISSASRTSTSCSSRSSAPINLRKRKKTDEISSDFKLPIFSPDLKQCILKDTFYTPSQRNRLIKEGCMALRGYCWEREQPVSNLDKRSLAKSLFELAPKSLGDSGSISSPEVSSSMYGSSGLSGVHQWFRILYYFLGWFIWTNSPMVSESYLHR